MGHSRPQSPRSLWSAPGIETSGRDRSRKSANHGLPAFVRSLRNLNNNGYYRLQKWAAIALARYLVPARGLDPWRRPKGSWALGTRMPMGWPMGPGPGFVHTPTPKAECFYCFEVFGTPDEKRSTSF